MQKVKQTAIKARKRYCEPHFLFILIIVYVKAVLADDSGNVESNQDSKVQVTVEGGELLGFGSANPRTEDRFDAGEYTTYYGNALGGHPGDGMLVLLRLRQRPQMASRLVVRYRLCKRGQSRCISHRKAVCDQT